MTRGRKKGYVVTLETKEKTRQTHLTIRKKRRAEVNKRVHSKQVGELNRSGYIIAYFSSQKEAAILTNISEDIISRICKDRRAPINGRRFIYL